MSSPKLSAKGEDEILYENGAGLEKMDGFSKQVHSGHHNWVTGTLGCK